MIVREKPILFCGDMVRAIQDGSKSETRRVMNPQPERRGGQWFWKTCSWTEDLCPTGTLNLPVEFCPYGQPGDRLWVRETFCEVPMADGRIGFIYKADGEKAFENIEEGWDFTGPWKPSIFMPRWASRITLEITNVRVERVSEISAESCLAEGIQLVARDTEDVRAAYRRLWDSLNAKRDGGKFAWDKNPFVFVIQFRKL